MSASDFVIALGTGISAGILAGVLGTGGGFFIVPVLVIFLDRAQTVAQGTSLLAIIATAAMGTYGNARRRTMPWPVVKWLAIGGAAGAAAGAWLALNLFGEATLRRVFGIVLMATALRTARGHRSAEEQESA